MLGNGALLRSTDGGRRFVRVAAPPLPSRGTVPTIVFASPRDGYAYVSFSGRLYATDDGGESWQRTGAATAVSGFAVSGAYAYVVFGRRQYMRSRVGRNGWRTIPLPFPLTAGPVGLAVTGSDVWVLGTGPSHKPQSHSQLAKSNDAGLRFEAERSPCYPGLGGTLHPVSRSVVWATCPSGMMAAAFRSTDAGRTWRDLATPPLTNAASLAPSSARSAVLARVVEAPLLRTTDGGRSWRHVRQPARVAATDWIAFSTGRVGAALVETGTSTAQLWRTVDGGASWRNVPLR